MEANNKAPVTQEIMSSSLADAQEARAAPCSKAHFSCAIDNEVTAMTEAEAAHSVRFFEDERAKPTRRWMTAHSSI